jgi:hypothetical protein
MTFVIVSSAYVLWPGPLLALQSRLSMAVAEVSTGTDVQQFLQNPGLSYIQAYVFFASDFPNDVLINLDEEFVDGVNNPLYVSGGDWMAFVGIQRTGIIWVAAGTRSTMRGNPSATPNWQIFNLGVQLQSNTWYLLRTVADFSTRYFKSFTVVGPGINTTIDLSAYLLDYPNYMPFDNRVMTYYVGNARSANTANGSGAPLVYIDDVSGGTFWPDGTDHPLFSNGFESQSVVGPQPVSAPPIPVENYVQGEWYLERSESLFTIQQEPFARSGTYVGVANASLN